MSHTEALNLRTGDRVRYRSCPQHTGTVTHQRKLSLVVRWRIGSVIAYWHGSMAHIERAPEPTP